MGTPPEEIRMRSHRERADIAAYCAQHPDASHTRALRAVRAE